MKKTLLAILTTVLGILPICAQNPCNKRLIRAQKFLENNREVSQPSLRELETYIAGCLTDESNSLYLQGLVLIKKRNDVSYKEATELFTLAAKLGHVKSKTFLGYIYKNGWGTPIDFKRSMSWFEQAADLKDEDAIYSVGYYYLKGLGGVEQNYGTAVSYFKKSNHPMSNYWLAFCRYYGLGTTSRKNTAVDSLKRNPGSMSKLLLNNLTTGKQKENFVTADQPEYSISNSIPISKLINEPMTGNWIEKDWSGEKIIRNIPVSLKFNSENDIYLKLNNKEYEIELNKKGAPRNKSEFVLPPLFIKSEDSLSLTYSLKDVSIISPEEGIVELKMKTWINEFFEFGPPVVIRAVVENLLEKKIEESFLVYPNSFSSIVNISFELEKKSMGSLVIYDMIGIEMFKEDLQFLENGLHIMEYNGSHLQPGTYITVLEINGFRFSRTIIKSTN